MHTYLLTYSMEQSPSWEANWFSASQEIPYKSMNPKVHYRIHQCPPPAPILCQLDPVHALHPTSRRSILILFSHLCLGLQIGLFPLGFPSKTLYMPLLSSPQLILLCLIAWTILGEEKISFSLCRYRFITLHSEQPTTFFSHLLWPPSGGVFFEGILQRALKQFTNKKC